jgi:UDP-glucose:(heptosyl)LPS alpha-1,3-glucosyltransferase
LTILLYRPSLDFTSGAGQLMWMQLRALRAAGERAEIGCERGALKFFLRSGARTRRLSAARVRAGRADRLVVDHGLCIPNAALVFVHNLATEASVHVPRSDWHARVEAERTFFRELGADVPLVANSRLVKNALVAHFGIAAGRVVVHHPGFRSERFNPRRAAELRDAARRELGVAVDAPLVGLITSGDFAKRGLDLFLDSAERIASSWSARSLCPTPRGATRWSRTGGSSTDGRGAIPSVGSPRSTSFSIPRGSRNSGSWLPRRRPSAWP